MKMKTVDCLKVIFEGILVTEATFCVRCKLRITLWVTWRSHQSFLPVQSKLRNVSWNIHSLGVPLLFSQSFRNHIWMLNDTTWICIRIIQIEITQFKIFQHYYKVLTLMCSLNSRTFLSCMIHWLYCPTICQLSLV